MYALALIAGVFPLIVILLTAAFYTRSFYDAQVGALGLGLSLGLTVTLTDIIKVSRHIAHVMLKVADQDADHGRSTSTRFVRSM